MPGMSPLSFMPLFAALLYRHGGMATTAPARRCAADEQSDAHRLCPHQVSTARELPGE